MSPAPTPTSADRLFARHPRQWGSFQYVYPVISRRSRGLSIGINLNADKVCNWDCVYCQVDRTQPPARRDVDLEQVRRELDGLLAWSVSGQIWQEGPLAGTPQHLRQLRDIAFSGDGEPTTFPAFDQAVALAAEAKQRHDLTDTRLVVLTNLSMIHRPAVAQGLALLDQAGGEVWAKLDAGTDAYYKQVDRAAGRLEQLVENIRLTGQSRSLVIQSMFMELHGAAIPDAEFDAYLDRLEELIDGGCRIRLVQIYTIARQTAEPYAAPLSRTRLESLLGWLKRRLPDLPAETFGGIDRNSPAVGDEIGA